MLVVGDLEAAESKVSVRSRTGGNHGAQPLDEFVRTARQEVQDKKAVDGVFPEVVEEPKTSANAQG